MTYATDNTIDFRSIAKELVGSSPRNINVARELVPTEARARRQREGNQFLRRPNSLGSTVDQEGLTNNYAVEPDMYYASFPSPEQARNYVMQGAAAALLVTAVILTSFIVS
ncbi:MAG: ssl1498 family light-harvesting-like protein [Leptolyngbyaceae bacterium]|nr:ssl1498 family light-harvesting-like protein [Leptolyngbyaceae bacterium]